MALNIRNAIFVVLLVVMVAAMSTPTATAAEIYWDQCIQRCKGEKDACTLKCNQFCKNEAAAVRYLAASTGKLKEAANASPEKAAALKNEADEYLALAKKYNDAAGTP
jgi:hypothetical protein